MSTAWRLFCEQGYDATTYAAIAKACGISRNLVQYHYPKKEQFAFAFMDHLLEEVQHVLGYADEQLNESPVAVLEVGSCFFTYLIENEGRRTFLRDILRNRDFSGAILNFDAEWALARMSGSREYDKTAVLRSVMAYMGGFYELLYYCLVNDLPIDPAEELQTVVVAFAVVLGFDKDATRALLRENTPSAERIEKVVRAVEL